LPSSNKKLSRKPGKPKSKYSKLFIKADEEFNIEKGKLVRAETVNIEAFFQKKLKQSDVQRKMFAVGLT
jgi:V-type H+-transporting ATPase subunit E